VALDIGMLTDREERQTFAVGKPAPMEHFDAPRARTAGAVLSIREMERPSSRDSVKISPAIRAPASA
jgi:hypothetical protein